MMGYEAHLSDFLKVFGDPFSYVTVVKWTLENEKVFVVVKCNYVTVGLKDQNFYLQNPLQDALSFIRSRVLA